MTDEEHHLIPPNKVETMPTTMLFYFSMSKGKMNSSYLEVSNDEWRVFWWEKSELISYIV